MHVQTTLRGELFTSDGPMVAAAPGLFSSAMSTAPGAHFSPDTATETATPGSHRRLLRNMSNSIAKQSSFVAQSTKAAEQRKISTLVASFLPSGLLEQLSKAVDDQSVNPRVPMERPGVYVCISLSGLHQMLELPIEDYVFDKQLRQIFRRIAQSVHGAGGELIRMTGEHVLAVWSLPPPSEPFQNSAPPGSPGVQGSSFEERLLRAALNGATACALTVVDMLHDSLLWEEMNDSDQSQARTKQDPKPQQQQQQQQQQQRVTASSEAAQTPRFRWGNARESVRGARGDVKGSSLFGVVKAAARSNAERPNEFRLHVGASLTVACAQAMHVGGANGRWEYVVCAPELVHAQHVLKQVDMGEVLIAESLWSAFSPTSLQPHIKLDEWKRLPQGTQTPSHDSALAMEERTELMKSMPLAAMKSYVPGTIWAKILARDPKWIAEQGDRRFATLLVIRCWAPTNVPLVMQVAAYSAAVSLTQSALYKHTGTFKHMIQDHEGCTIVAGLGLPPFEYSEVGCSRGGVSAALEIRAELERMNLNSRAVVLTGKVWIGAVGAESRREYMLVGEPMQLALQMLEFTSNDNPVIVDAVTSQANLSKYNFSALPVSIQVPGRLKQHTILAIKEPRPIETMHKGRRVPFDISQWLRSHNKLRGASTTNMAKGISDSALQQLRECFNELDDDNSGTVSHEELLEAIREIDTGEAGKVSMRENVAMMIKAMDRDGDGVISFDEFLAMAAAAAEADSGDYTTKQPTGTQNLPLLLNARTTRKRLQNELGEEFAQYYHRRSNRAPSAAGNLNRRPSRVQKVAALLVDGDDLVGFAAFCDVVRVAEPERSFTDAEMKQYFHTFDTSGNGTADRREYMRMVLLNRFKKAAGRTIDVFRRLDADRTGRINLKTFKRGMQSLGFTQEAGFLDEDLEAVFAAIDEDGSRTLEYNELAMALQLTRTFQGVVDRLRPNVGSSVQPRGAFIAALRRKSKLPLPQNSISIGEWRREQRKESVRDVLTLADAEANAIERRQSVAAAAEMRRRASVQQGEAPPTNVVQAMSDEVDKIYEQYKEIRSKLGPLRDPLADRTGTAAALVSPRINTISTADKGEPSLAHLTLSPRHSKLGTHSHSPQTARFTTESNAPSSPGTASRFDIKSVATTPRSSMHDKPRGLFPGPALMALEPLPRSIAAPAAPPSLQLASSKRESSQNPQGRLKRRSSVLRRWGAGQVDEEVELAQAVRRGTSRDHSTHIAATVREGTPWQKELRLEERERLYDAKTTSRARIEQQIRLHAFHCVRDADRAMRHDLELGHFGNTGLAIGSPPRSPEHESVMRNWVGPPAISAADVQELSRANRAAEVKERNVSSLSLDEQRKWLHEPIERGSFAQIADILERHGVAEEFKLAGAPGLGANADDAASDEEEAAFGSLDAILKGFADGDTPEGVRPPPSRESDLPALSSPSMEPNAIPRHPNSVSPRRPLQSHSSKSSLSPRDSPAYTRSSRISFASWTNLKKK